jgi:hypothetical protein
MGWGRRWWRGACVLAAFGGVEISSAAGAPAAGTSAAGASLFQWSSGVTIGRGSHSLQSVSCPSATQCTVVDDDAQEVTFDPGAPGAATRATVAESSLLALACPSVHECTAVGVGRQAVTFDPGSPDRVIEHRIDSFDVVPAIACPGVSQCTAVDNRGLVVTFDPKTGKIRGQRFLSLGQVGQIVCPAMSRCTAIAYGAEDTFDPQDLARAKAPLLIGGAGEDADLIACPALGRCVAAGEDGVAAFSTPQVPRRLSCASPSSAGSCPPRVGRASTLRVRSLRLIAASKLSGLPNGIACWSASRCVVLGPGDLFFVIDPAGPSLVASGRTPSLAGSFEPVCWAADRCLALRGGDAVSFAAMPGARAAATEIDAGVDLRVACGSSTLCVASDDQGVGFVFEALLA